MIQHNSAAWRRSSFCGTGACVEVAADDAHRFMRDAKEENGPMLAFSNTAWGSFVSGVKDGRFSAR